jgi:hypothetical protein
MMENQWCHLDNNKKSHSLKPIISNILAFIAGFLIGSVVNLGIVELGSIVVPAPEGVDVSSISSISSAMEQGLYELHHFVPPFIAHAAGTLVGAIVAYRLAASANAALAWGIGALFLLGGIFAAVAIPAPTWFIATDVLLAYLPMAWLAIRLSSPGKGEQAEEAIQ